MKEESYKQKYDAGGGTRDTRRDGNVDESESHEQEQKQFRTEPKIDNLSQQTMKTNGSIGESHAHVARNGKDESVP
jgi:hypothetical protein